MSSGKYQRPAHEGGFTYLSALLLITLAGAALGAVAESWTHARQREKEAELIWIGNQFKQAIGLYYQRSPGAVKRFPEKLEDLLEDRRFLSTQRYLRRIYADPMTGKQEWALIIAPSGGIAGVQSLSSAKPIRSSGSATAYSDWKFSYEPPAVLETSSLGKPTAR